MKTCHVQREELSKATFKCVGYFANFAGTSLLNMPDNQTLLYFTGKLLTKVFSR